MKVFFLLLLFEKSRFYSWLFFLEHSGVVVSNSSIYEPSIPYFHLQLWSVYELSIPYFHLQY